MRILIFNWRDIKNPTSGGAEILTHELARRWVERGNKVVMFCSFYKNAKQKESVDGVEIIREGNPDARHLWNSVHFKAFINYKRKFKGNFDVVIDEIHGLPFFTPLYVKEKKIALICEVAGGLWYKMYGSIFGSIGRLVEIIYLKLFYQQLHFLTISNSTKHDLISNGIKESYIHVIPMGVKLPNYKRSILKEKAPTLLVVGRLSKPKGIEDAIKVLEYVLKFMPSARLWIVGRGEAEYTNYLKKITSDKGLENKVVFYGYVSEDEKFSLMSRAHLLLVPSTKEGFGLTIPEAGFAGTLSIVYKVSGLRDIVEEGVNGIIVNKDPLSMGKAVVEILSDKKKYAEIRKNAIEFSKRFDYEASGSETLNLIAKYSL
ncbi:MAG: hypothetical protein A2687_01630 [Candidatus Levybacteria bacterium RIFCSPHIGHO2_01_FULL_38_26]|nr:MAG: hypothetical protein A2687_01630 [Candidatus Levybacteria bacterium RIFCSPHIGHO2_01_FULL_38_26]